MRFLDARPHMKSSAAANSATAAPPIAMPAIAPAERPELLLDAAGVLVGGGAAVDDVDVAAAVDAAADELELENGLFSSAGHGCPGSSIKVEFFAFCVCTSTDSVPFGLIPPTIP